MKKFTTKFSMNRNHYKKIRQHAYELLLIVILLPTVIFSQIIRIEDISLNDGEGSPYFSLVLDNGVPQITFYDPADTLIYFAIRQPNGLWAKHRLSLKTGRAGWSSIIIDNFGRHNVVYTNPLLGEVRYSGWLPKAPIPTIRAIGGTDDYGKYLSMSTDRNGDLSITYQNESTKEIIYAHKENNSWIKQPIFNSVIAPTWSSLVFDDKNRPSVVLNDAEYGEVKYVGWLPPPPAANLEIVDEQGNVGKYPSMIFDKTNQPLISYYDESNQDLKFASKSGSGWFKQIVDADGNTGNYSSIQQNKSGVIGIVYNNSTVGMVKYASTDYKFDETTYSNISGIVLDKISKNPISNARVQFYPHRTGSYTITDKEGKWYTKIPAGRGYILKISSGGYEPYIEKNINIAGNSIIDFRHELNPMNAGDYRVVPATIISNPDTLKIPQGGFGYAWFKLEGLYVDQWFPVQSGIVKAYDSNGDVFETEVNTFLYEFLTTPFQFEDYGLFGIKIPAEKIGDGLPGDVDVIKIEEINNLRLSSNHIDSIIVKICEYEYSTKWGYRIYGKAGLGATTGFVKGTGFVGGGSGSAINVFFKGLDENSTWSKFKVFRRNDLFLGVELKIGPPRLIKTSLSSRAEIGGEIKASFPYQEEYEFDMDELEGLEALSAFYLFAEPSITLIPAVGQITVSFLGWTIQTLIENNDINGIGISRVSDESGLDIEGSINAEVGLGLDITKKIGLKAAAGLGAEAHIGGSIKKIDNSFTYSKEINKRFYVNGKYDPNFNIGPNFETKDLKAKFLYLHNLNNILYPNNTYVGFEILTSSINDIWQYTMLTASLGSNQASFKLYNLPGDEQRYQTHLRIKNEKVKNVFMSSAKLPTEVLSIGEKAISLAIDNNTFNDDYVKFLETLYNQQENDTSMNLEYNVNVEDIKTFTFDLDLEFPLPAVPGIFINLGGGIDASSIRNYEIANGYWVRSLPFFQTEMSNPPIHQLSFNDMIKELWARITNGEVWDKLKDVILSNLKHTWFLGIVEASNSKFYLDDKGSSIILDKSSIPPNIDSVGCRYWEWYNDNFNNQYLSFKKQSQIRNYILKLREIREKIIGSKYGIGGFFRFEPINIILLDTAILTIKYNDSELENIDENTLALFYEDSSGNWQHLPSTVFPDSNKVVAKITKFKTYTLAPRLPSGVYSLHSDIEKLPADGTTITKINSDVILNNDGTVVKDGELFTVKYNRGKILTQDVDTSQVGIQIPTNEGIIQFDFQVDSIPLPIKLEAVAVNGFAACSTELTLLDVTIPQRPELKSVYPVKDGIVVKWLKNNEPDLAGYKVWFDTDSSGAPYNGTASVFGENSPITVGNVDSVLLKGISKDSTYYIAITAFDISGNESEFSNELTVVTEIENPKRINIPKDFYISQNYPNPFNPITKIKYSIPKTADVKINIYNILGQSIRILVNKRQEPGTYEVVWDGTNNQNRKVATGIYFYRIQAENFVKVKKMMLIR